MTILRKNSLNSKFSLKILSKLATFEENFVWRFFEKNIFSKILFPPVYIRFLKKCCPPKKSPPHHLSEVRYGTRLGRHSWPGPCPGYNFCPVPVLKSIGTNYWATEKLLWGKFSSKSQVSSKVLGKIWNWNFFPENRLSWQKFNDFLQYLASRPMVPQKNFTHRKPK